MGYEISVLKLIKSIVVHFCATVFYILIVFDTCVLCVCMCLYVFVVAVSVCRMDLYVPFVCTSDLFPLHHFV